jgi:hypothetical protein
MENNIKDMSDCDAYFFIVFPLFFGLTGCYTRSKRFTERPSGMTTDGIGESPPAPDRMHAKVLYAVRPSKRFMFDLDYLTVFMVSNAE